MLWPGWLEEEEISSDGVEGCGGWGGNYGMPPALTWSYELELQMHISRGTLLCQRLENNFSQSGRTCNKMINVCF